MTTTVTRKPTSFRLSETLLIALKRDAKEANRSLSNYVECLLADSVVGKLNEDTLAAMQEAESGRELETLDLNNFKKYVDAL